MTLEGYTTRKWRILPVSVATVLLAANAGTSQAAEPTPGASFYREVAGGEQIVTQIDERITVLESPGQGSVFQATNYYIDGGPHAYFGLQESNTPGEGHIRWSTWNVGKQLTYEKGDDGAGCGQVQELGDVLACGADSMKVEVGHRYDFQVKFDPATHKATATVIDETGKTEFVKGKPATDRLNMGSITIPGSKGIYTTNWTNFVENYGGYGPSTCTGIPHSRTRFGPATVTSPTLGTVPAKNPTTTPTNPGCSGKGTIYTPSDDGRNMEVEIGLGNSARYGLVFDSGTCADSKAGTAGLVAAKPQDPSQAGATCKGKDRTTDKLFVFAKDGTLHRVDGSLEDECLQAPAAAGGQITRAACDSNNKAQQWKYDSSDHIVKNPSTKWVMALGTGGTGDANVPVIAEPRDASNKTQTVQFKELPV